MTNAESYLHNTSSAPFVHFPNAHMHHDTTLIICLPPLSPPSLWTLLLKNCKRLLVWFSGNLLELLNERWSITLTFKSRQVYRNLYLLFHYFVNNAIRMAQRKVLLKLFCDMEDFSLLSLASLNRAENSPETKSKLGKLKVWHIRSYPFLFFCWCFSALQINSWRLIVNGFLLKPAIHYYFFWTISFGKDISWRREIRTRTSFMESSTLEHGL